MLFAIVFVLCQSFMPPMTMASMSWTGNSWNGETWEGETWNGKKWHSESWDSGNGDRQEFSNKGSDNGRINGPSPRKQITTAAI